MNIDFWAVNDPKSYKIFRSFDPKLGNFNMPLVPRFVQASSTPGKLAQILVQDSSYEIHTDCNTYTVHNLGNVVNEVWYAENLGGSLPANLKTLIISYRWSCDKDFTNCKNKEQFHLAYPYGLVRWQHQSWNGSSYDPPDKQSTFNTIVPGTIVPVMGCSQF